MRPVSCNICETRIEAPVYSSLSETSITSTCQLMAGETNVYLCGNCAHIQTTEIADIDQYYDSGYNLLLDSEEEDQVYSIVGGKEIYRYDHQVATLMELVDIPARAKVLDYGCAKAACMRKLAQQRQDIEPYLFDVSDAYLPFWEKFLQPHQWSIHRLPDQWKSNFDLITSFFALEHVAAPRSMLDAVAGLLKEGGLFYCIVPNVMENIADFVVVDHVNHFTVRSIEQLFQSCGFELTKIDTSSHNAAIIIIAKYLGAQRAGESHPTPVMVEEDDNNAVIEMANYWKGIGKRIRKYENESGASEKAAIYGSGFYGSYILTAIRDKSRVVCFLDRDPFRQGRECFGIRVAAPDDLPAEVNRVYVGLNPRIARKNIEMIDSWKQRNISLFYL